MLTDEEIKTASREELDSLYQRIGTELARRDRHRVSNVIDARAWPTPSDVVESRPHEDGWLQREHRKYVAKDGHLTLRGPYWYFRYHEDGKQKKIYLGKTDTPESKLAEKRGARMG